jgi:sec-independent protein translocase protein TatA
MPFRLGPVELILVLLLALVIFGPGRIAQLGSELGKSISAFQEEIKKGNEDPNKESTTSGAA